MVSLSKSGLISPTVHLNTALLVIRAHLEKAKNYTSVRLPASMSQLRTPFLLTIEGFRKNTADDLCSASSLSFAYSGTKFWPGDRSGLAFWTAATFSPCWCKRWRRIPAPTRGSEIWNMDTSSSLYEECLKKKVLFKKLNSTNFGNRIRVDWANTLHIFGETQEKTHVYVSNWVICFILGMITFQPTVMA